MYRRLAERIIGIIGLVVAGIYALLGGFSMAAARSPEMKTELSKLDVEDVDGTIETMFTSGMVSLIVAGIATIVAFIAVLLLKSEKKATLPGTLFIVAGGFISIGLFPGGLIAGILLIVAGIVAIMKKPSEEETFTS